jgi:glucokinase
MTTLAVDFGGTRIKLGVVRDGKVIAFRVLPAESHQPLAARLENIALALEALCAEQGLATRDCAGVGFSYPSIIDRWNARILDHFGKFGDARSLDLRHWSRERLGLPLAIDNDARMALIGEWRQGAGRGCDNCAMITLGTGIGVSAIIEGKILRGVHGQAGILGGHTTLRPEGGPCVCGNIGCAELEASSGAIARIARNRSDFEKSALAQESVVDYAAIFRLAEQGDSCALALRDSSVQIWSALTVNLIHVFDPEMVILGGGIMGSASFILPEINKYVARHAHTPWGKVKVVASELGDQAALVACEWLLREELEESVLR